MTDHTVPAPALWQHLVQWQPATAAALAQHLRTLPDDWPLRVFGTGRVDAALALPPGAIGEQFPDRTPEIAPYDEIAPLDDCPACQEVEGTCRFHEGYAAGHHETVQAQLDAVRVDPGMGLREFMRWRADVEEAEDRGQEPPVMPAPAAPVVVPPATDQTGPGDVRAQLLHALDFSACQTLGYGSPEGLLAAYDTSRTPADQAPATDQTNLRKAVAEALARRDGHDWGPGKSSLPSGVIERYHQLADAVLAVLPDTGRAAETDEERADREETERDHARGDHTHCGITCEAEMPTEHLRNFVIAKGYPGTKGALDELLRRARTEAAELRRLADEKPDTQPLTAEGPARIDRLRPEFTEHASIDAIDAQLDRARRQQRRWHLRAEWLIGLRHRRAEQQDHGEQPA